MSQQITWDGDFTIPAAADLSTKKYHFLRISAEQTVNVAGNAAVDVIGIQQDDNGSAAGRPVLVRPLGAPTSLLTMGAAVAAGAPIAPDANGRGRTAVATERFFARALEASTANGDVVEVMPVTGTV